MNKSDHYLLPIIPFYSRIMNGGEGSYVADQTGKKYLDLNAGQFCTILGNNNPELVSYMQQNMNRLLHTNTELLTEEVITASKNLNRISGDMDGYSIFLSTGAEAVEFCLRFAKHIKKKKGVACFNRGYHGLTLGAQSVTFGGVYAAPEVTDIYSIDIPDALAGSHKIDESIEQLERILKEHAHNIAALLIEPIVSVGGMIFPPDRYFELVRKICDRYDILLIFDECQTGFGRTGTWFYYQQLNCVPDMAACAKAAGLGFPVSFAMFRSDLVKTIGNMTHYSSHQNDTFAALLVNFGIQYMESNQILENNQKKGRFFLDELKKLEKRCSKVSNARGKGLMLGLDLNQNTVTDTRQYFRQLSEDALEQGLIIQGTNAGKTLRFLPNYLISNEEIMFSIHTIEQLLK